LSVEAEVARSYETELKAKKLENALEKLRRTRLLNIIPGDDSSIASDIFMSYSLNCEDLIGHASNEDYEEVYLRNLKEVFGLEIVNILVDEINEEREKADREKAKEIADKWIHEAKEVRWNEISKEQIIMSAQLYLATVELMKKYNCNAVTMSIGPVLRIGKIPVRPPLAEMELAKSGIVTSCESLIDCLVTQLLGFYITGKLGFVGDVITKDWLRQDLVSATFTVGHCYAPINPYGDDRRVPYIIRSHAVTPSTVGIQVELPLNETVTVAKLSVYDKKISVFTGKTVDGRSLYKDFDNIACRTKVVVKTNNEKPMKNYYKEKEIFGCHRVVFYTDFREEIKELATLIGFEVIEEDR